MRFVLKNSLHRQLSSTSRAPILPSGLSIDRDKALANTAPPYTKHVVISTGRDNWASRIEDEEGPNFAKGLKALLGRDGKFHDPNNNVLITNSSFETTKQNPKGDTASASAYVFPDFRYIRHIKNTPDGQENFVRKYLSPNSGRPLPSHKQFSSKFRDFSATPINMFRQSFELFDIPVFTPIILVCGHTARDQRCGIYGPLLQTEFNLHIDNINRSKRLERARLEPVRRERIRIFQRAALISHVGGHEFAGNVIVYIPPQYEPYLTEKQGYDITKPYPLAGMGIWYGRVEPERVRDIVGETLEQGRIIKELFRGGIDVKGGPLAIDDSVS